ncbi:MAG: hypothetical protein ACYTAN_09520 [Planctomycetota bacterium]|jgi:hypothetical protein
MWTFCLNSLFREYGWQFFSRVALPHPLKTARAVIASGALDFSGGMTAVSPEGPGRGGEGALSIVGVGFCLKPMDPPCPSGRPNHDCHYLENLTPSEPSDIPVPCRQCAIREIGTMTLKTGAAFYIMTSARDILLDVFVPALEEGRFSSGFFVLCRYSLRPFAVALLTSGMRACLFAFESGDCRDYATWLRADRGIKDEQTVIDEPNQARIRELLEDAAKEPAATARFERRGNVLYARMAIEKPRERTGMA